MNHNVFVDALKNDDVPAVLRGLQEHPAFANKKFRLNKDTEISPIHFAAMHGFTELASLLAEHAANINEVVTITNRNNEKIESYQSTPLELAYRHKHFATAIALIKKKARCYSGNDADREIMAFKSAVVDTYSSLLRVDELTALQAPAFLIPGAKSIRDRFDTVLDIIAKRNGKLARRIPKASPANGNILNDEFLAFAEVVSIACKANYSSGNNDNNVEPIVDFLEHTKGSWKDILSHLRIFSEADFRGFSDVVNAFTQTVVLPEYARKIETLIRANKVSPVSAIYDLQPVVAKALIADRSLAVMLDLQRAWHNDRAVLEAAIRQPKFARKGKWLPLTKNYTASNGLTISFITSAKELNDLGEDQKHCVGGYAYKCMREPIHVGVIKDGDKILSTFEINEAPKKRELITMQQHRRGKNLDVPTAAPEAAALREFMEQVEKRTIKINFNALREHRRNIAQEANDVRYICGFDPFEDKNGINETKALQQYIKIRTGGREDSVVKSGESSLIPGGEHKWGKATAKDFLEQTGIMKKIDELAASPRGVSGDFSLEMG